MRKRNDLVKPNMVQIRHTSQDNSRITFLFLTESIQSGGSNEGSQRMAGSDLPVKTKPETKIYAISPGPEVKKVFFLLNSVDHEIFPAHKC